MERIDFRKAARNEMFVAGQVDKKVEGRIILVVDSFIDLGRDAGICLVLYNTNVPKAVVTKKVEVGYIYRLDFFALGMVKVSMDKTKVQGNIGCYTDGRTM